MTDNIKRMDIKEFRDSGYLQEANRCFFHPLGLALEVTVDQESGDVIRVWDYRDDPEGIIFAEGMIDREKAWKIGNERSIKNYERWKRFGYTEQPIPPLR